jgi:hypothetical protein
VLLATCGTVCAAGKAEVAAQQRLRVFALTDAATGRAPVLCGGGWAQGGAPKGTAPQARPPASSMPPRLEEHQWYAVT